MSNPNCTYAVGPFDANGEILPADIASTHLSIREWQVGTGQNTFSNILDSQPDLNGLENYYISPGGNFFVATDKSRLLGFIGLRNDGEGQGVIKRLAVIPDEQRRGIGKTLAGSIIDWAREAGFSKLTLHTNIGEKARALYEQFGFEIKGWVPEHEDWYMELELKQF